MTFTTIIERSDDGWFVGQIEEEPAALSQAKTIDELKENLKDALELIFMSNKEEIAKTYKDRIIIKETISIV